jgi:hypothetical protein
MVFAGAQPTHRLTPIKAPTQAALRIAHLQAAILPPPEEPGDRTPSVLCRPSPDAGQPRPGRDLSTAPMVSAAVGYVCRPSDRAQANASTPIGGAEGLLGVAARVGLQCGLCRPIVRTIGGHACHLVLLESVTGPKARTMPTGRSVRSHTFSPARAELNVAVRTQCAHRLCAHVRLALELQPEVLAALLDLLHHLGVEGVRLL